MLRQLWLILTCTIVLIVVLAAYTTRERWQPWLSALWRPESPVAQEEEDHHDHADRIKLTPQAQKNLGLVIRPAQLTEVYWRSLQIPAVITDRPGQSDRGVTAPITGVVSKIHAFPSDIVRPGDALFDLRITSEFLQNTQAELFKTVKEMELQSKLVKRLEAASGSVSEASIIQARNQLTKLSTQVQSYRQILQSRGLNSTQINNAAEGNFIDQVTVVTPPGVGEDQLVLTGKPTAPEQNGTAYEVQELKVQLGEQVQAGQVLGMLANHRFLYIEGRAFKSEAPLLARAAENAWSVEAEFAEDDRNTWPELKQTLTIRHLANTVDPASRTFGFYIPLVNQSRTYDKDDKTFLIWRFRPGQRVRLHVRVEPIRGAPVEGKSDEYTGVIVLPREAVVREGPEAYVFRVNGDVFVRKPVNVLFEDRKNAVLANDGSIPPGLYIAHNAAAALNRVLKAQQAGGDTGHDHHHH